MSNHYESMISVLHKSLESTNGLVKVPLNDEEIVLCYRNTHDEIDDPECDEIFQALSPGVFRRFTVHTGDQTRFTWMRFSNLDQHELRSAFKRDFESLSDQDIEGIKVSLVFQKMKRDDAEERNERRMSM